MKKRWNAMGKMTVCSLAAVMMVMVGTRFGMAARAETITESEAEIQEVLDTIPESENMDALQDKAPAMLEDAQDVQDKQEAGDAENSENSEIEMTQIVVIEENLIPGASHPDLDSTKEGAKEPEAAGTKEKADGPKADPQEGTDEPEADPQEGTDEPEADPQEEVKGPETDSQEGIDEPEADPQEEAGGPADTQGEAEAQPQEETGEVKEPEADPQENESEACMSGTITYEDSEVAITVIASEEAQLPADTEVKVVRLAEGSAEYEEAKEAVRQSVGAGENASYAFYNVTLESEGQALDVEEGTVSVRMELKAETNTKKKVVKIEKTENGKVARNVTDRAAAGRTGSVAFPY